MWECIRFEQKRQATTHVVTSEAQWTHAGRAVPLWCDGVWLILLEAFVKQMMPYRTFRKEERKTIMKRAYNFNAGPSAMPLEVLQEAQAEFLNYANTGMSIIEMSHRSADYAAMHA